MDTELNIQVNDIVDRYRQLVSDLTHQLVVTEAQLELVSAKYISLKEESTKEHSD